MLPETCAFPHFTKGLVYCVWIWNAKCPNPTILCGIDFWYWATHKPITCEHQSDEKCEVCNG